MNTIKFLIITFSTLTFFAAPFLNGQSKGGEPTLSLSIELGDKSELPNSVFNSPELETLKICGDCFCHMQSDIRKLYNLRVLDLSNTVVYCLPEELSHLRRLQEIYLPYNNWWYRLDKIRIYTRAKIILCD